MGKKGRSRQKNEKSKGKMSTQYDDGLSSDDMHDEIDAFHKQRDIIPLDINDDDGESDEDEELPVFDLKVSDDDEDDDEDVAGDDANDDMTKKIIRQKRYLRAKFGGGDDGMHYDDDDDEDEDEDDDKPFLVGKHFRHGADNRHFELQSSDDEALKEEEELAKQLQRERAKFYTEEDYDLLDLKESSFKGKDLTEPLTLEDMDRTYKVEDLIALSKDEQIDMLNRSDPELAFWLSELKEAHDELEHKINPFLSKVKDGKIATEGVSYFELKKVFLLLYCQAITFYLLLKSEGKPVHEHPVMDRLEEIKKLLDQVQKLDAKLPDDIDEENHGLEMVLNSGSINAAMADSVVENQDLPPVSDALLKATVSQKVAEMQKVNSLKDNVNEERKQKHQHKEDPIGVQSSEMLKIRASLEEKLRQKYTSSAQKHSRPFNGWIEKCDDFDDDTVGTERAAKLGNALGSLRIPRLVNLNQKEPKVVSGDVDLPKRDDIGERRRKHELRVLAAAGSKYGDADEERGDPGSNEVADVEDGEREDLENEVSDSENELYEQIKRQRAERLAAKAKSFSRNSGFPSLSEPDTLDAIGRRPISYEMEKNRGLTRYRKKLTKNPRKKYKEKHKKALKKRSGQVRSVKKPAGPYGGELSGINPNVSRSVRFKS